MTLIDLDKFVASFITEMKECSQMRNFSIPRCIKKALLDQELDYKNGEIVKVQRRISAEAKEVGYCKSEDDKEIVKLADEYYDKVLLKECDMKEKEAHHCRIAYIHGAKAMLERQKQKSSNWNEEEERIRKELFELINGFCSMDNRPFTLQKADEWLAWLEKQGSNLVKNGYTNNKDVIEYAGNYSREIWHKLMDNFKNIKDYHIGCNDVSDIVLNAIINTYNWIEKQGTSYTKRDVDDAFVEKAWDWIEDNMLSSNQQDKSLLYYEQFKKYLEE